MSQTSIVVLSVAGFDPGSGAGITADVKTAAAHGCYAVTCATALTVQSTSGVRRIQPVAGELVKETLQDLAADFEIRAVRIGMLGTAEVANAVADFLDEAGPPNVVLDPVIRSSSGAELLDAKGVDVLKKRLLSLVTVVTPNIDEAAALAGMDVRDIDGMKRAAARLHRMNTKNVVVTGGHLSEAIDLLSIDSGDDNYLQEEISSPRLESPSTHGTGCAFATSLACNLARGKPLRESVIAAKAYVREAIEKAVPLGHGIGPLNHLHR